MTRSDSSAGHHRAHLPPTAGAPPLAPPRGLDRQLQMPALVLAAFASLQRRPSGRAAGRRCRGRRQSRVRAWHAFRPGHPGPVLGKIGQPEQSVDTQALRSTSSTVTGSARFGAGHTPEGFKAPPPRDRSSQRPPAARPRWPLPEVGRCRPRTSGNCAARASGGVGSSNASSPGRMSASTQVLPPIM